MSYSRNAILLAGLAALFMSVGCLLGGAAGATIALAGAAATDLFATHSSTENRIAALQRLAPAAPAGQPSRPVR